MNELESKLRASVNTFLASVMDAVGVADRCDLLDSSIVDRVRLPEASRLSGDDNETWETVRDHHARLGALETAYETVMMRLSEAHARIAVLEKAALETLGQNPQVASTKKQRTPRMPRQAGTEQELTERVVRVLQEVGSPMAMGDLSAAVGMPPVRVRSLLHSAIQSGRVVMSGQKRMARYSVVAPAPSALVDDPYAPESQRVTGLVDDPYAPESERNPDVEEQIEEETEGFDGQ